MWNYTDKVMDHYRNPRNVGAIEDADAVGEAGSLSCGDMLKLYLKVDKNGIITDAKFQTFGCGSAVASSSILTEMVIGKHIDEARKITNKGRIDITEAAMIGPTAAVFNPRNSRIPTGMVNSALFVTNISGFS